MTVSRASQLLAHTVALTVYNPFKNKSEHSSGVIITNGLVLTVAHGLPNNFTNPKVTYLEQSTGLLKTTTNVKLLARVCENTLDLAVLSCPDLTDHPDLTLHTYSTSCTDQHPVVISGYPGGGPAAKERGGYRAVRGTHTPAQGTNPRQHPSPTTLHGTVTINTQDRPDTPDRKRSLWAGISGSGVFRDIQGTPQLIGILTSMPDDGFENALRFTHFGKHFQDSIINRELGNLTPTPVPDTPPTTTTAGPSLTSLRQLPAGLCALHPVSDFKDNPALDELESIALRWDNGQVVGCIGGLYVLHGLAGAGKSQVAAKFGQRCVDRGWMVISVNGTSVTSLINSYANTERLFPDAAELHANAEEDTIRQARALRARIANSPSPVVVLVDNVEQPPGEYGAFAPEQPDQNLSSWLPAGQHITYVVTSRAPALPHKLQATECIHVHGLTPQAAHSVLARHASPDEQHLVDTLCKEFAFMPLPLLQAAAYLSACGRTLTEYHTKLHSAQENDKVFRLSEQLDYPELAMQAIEMNCLQFLADGLPTIDKVVSVEDIALLWAVCDASGLDAGVVADVFDVDRDVVSDFVSAAQSASILNPTPDAHLRQGKRLVSVSMHRWVAQVLWCLAAPEKALAAVDRLIAACQVLCKNADASDGVNTRKEGDSGQVLRWSTGRQAAAYQVSAHLEAGSRVVDARYEPTPNEASQEDCESNAGCSSTSDSEVPARVLWAQGHQSAKNVLEIAGWVSKTHTVRAAIKSWRSAVAITQSVLGDNHPNTLTTGNNLANVLESSGAIAEAISMYRQVLADRQRVLGQDHPDTLSTRNNLAGALESSEAIAEAISMYRQVLADSQRVLGQDHPNTLTTRNNLAYALKSSGAIAEAISMYRQVLADSQRVLGQDHPDTLSTRNNLAAALKSSGAIAEAISMYRQVLADRQRVLGQDHPDTLTTRNNLAGALKASGATAEAISMYCQVLADRQRVLGQDHPDTLTTRNNLAGALKSSGAIAEAISMYRQVLADSQRVLGQDHPDTLTTCNNLAGALKASGATAEAISMYRQNLADQQRILEEDHPDTLTTCNNLAGALKASGAVAEAIRMYRQVLTHSQRVLGEDHPDTLTTRHDLAAALESSGAAAEAIRMYRQVLTHSQRVLGKDHPDTLAARNNLAGALKASGAAAEAIRMCRQLLTHCQRVLGKDHPGSLMTRHNLAMALFQTGHHDEAIDLMTTALKMATLHLSPDHPMTNTFQENLNEMKRRTQR